MTTSREGKKVESQLNQQKHLNNMGNYNKESKVPGEMIACRHCNKSICDKDCPISIPRPISITY